MKDLGTYHVKVELEDGSGFVMEWRTHGRYMGPGRAGFSTLGTSYIPPGWNTEQEVLEAIQYTFREGNFSCDCNLGDFLDHATVRDTGPHACGDSIRNRIRKFSVLKEDTEIAVFPMKRADL